MPSVNMQALDSQEVLPAELRAILKSISQAGGRGLLVGGFVRDRLLERPSKDYDVEVYGLSMEALEKVLRKHGPVAAVGKSFGVLLYSPLDIDFSLPRTDEKSGEGHRGFSIKTDPHLDFSEASRRRDLTINSIGWDPLSGELLDPHRGLDDLKAGTLRATDPRHFGEDPLRALRVMQFAARLDMQPTNDLVQLCGSQDLSQLSAERIRDEFIKLLTKSRKPSTGLAFLVASGLRRYFPILESLAGVEQDPKYHPEGDVWTHTLMVVDQAKSLIGNGETEEMTLELMLAALCHDFGKALGTSVDAAGRVSSAGHAQAGVEPTRAFLLELKFPKALVDKVSALVQLHLMPAWLISKQSADKAYRRLARKLYAAGTNPRMLYLMASADHLGRSTPEAKAKDNTLTDAFWQKITDLGLDSPLSDAVMGRHLLEHGIQPGPHMKEILDRCREYQDETGIQEPSLILDYVLSGQ